MVTYEDFENDYTEVDPNNRFAFTDANHIAVENLTRNEKAYIYKNFGVDHFGDFTIDLDIRGRDTGGTAGNDLMAVFVLANAIGSLDQLDSGTYISLSFYEFDISDPHNPTITLGERYNNASFTDGWEPASRDVWYYVRIIKSGTSLVCGLYSTAILRDAGDGTDGDYTNLSLTLHADHKFQYLYGVCSRDSGAAQRMISGDSKDFYIHPTAVTVTPTSSLVPRLKVLGMI